jgi:hypothetical protein
VNKYLSVPKFKYESLRSLSFLALPDDLMFSIDLQDGYWQVDMAANAHTYLGFEWEGKYYVFTVLPFGLATAPWAFTKVMREVCEVLRGGGVRMLNYLDDFLFLCGSKEPAALEQKAQVLQVFADSGLTINTTKSVLDLSRQVRHLGFAFDSVTGDLSIPQDRWDALQTQVNKLRGQESVVAREVARVTGFVSSCGLVFGPLARLMTRALHACKDTRSSWGARVGLSEAAQVELSFWASLQCEACVDCVWPRPPVVAEALVCTDASASAWAGIGPGGLLAHGELQPEQRLLSSAHRELLAVWEVLISFRLALQGKAVTLLTDSQNCAHIVRHGSSKADLQRLALDIFTWCRRYGVLLRVLWVPRNENEAADELSKWVDGDDYSVASHVFAQAELLWGPHTVDRFASHTAHVLPVYNSKFHCPGTAGVDALGRSWKGANNWLHPPVGLVGQVLMHMLKEGSCGTLLVPYWPKQPWWPVVQPVRGYWAPFVVGAVALPSLRGALVPGVSGNAGVHTFAGAGFLLRLDFTNRRTASLLPVEPPSS